MASIHKRLLGGSRKKTRWLVSWREGGRQRTKTFRALQAAEDFKASVRPLERTRHVAEVSPVVTVLDYARRWLPLVAATIEPSTHAGYEGVLRLHVYGAIGHLRVRDVRRGHVKELLTSKLREGLSVDRVRLIHATLRAMLEWALDDGVIRENPAQRVGRKLGLIRAPRQRQEEISPFTREERDLFHLTVARKDAAVYAFFFALERAGLRIGEGIALRVADVDLNRLELRVERSVSAFNRGTKAPKSGHGRTVEISNELAEVLADQLARRREEGLADGEVNPLLFPSRAGIPFRHGVLARRFKKLLRIAGLAPHRTPHDLRHTYATLALEAGADMHWLKEQMGHASIQLTVDTYGKWARARRGLANLLDRPAQPGARVVREGEVLTGPPVTITERPVVSDEESED